MTKNTFFNSFRNAKNANFDRLTWTTDCDVIIEHMQNLIVSTDSPLNSVPDRVLEHVPKVKTDQNMLILVPQVSPQNNVSAFENSEHSFNSEPCSMYWQVVIYSRITHSGHRSDGHRSNL